MGSLGGYQKTSEILNIYAFGDYLDAQLKRLPALPDVQQISPRVIRVLGQNPGEFTLQGTNTYIVGTGLSRLIIDTGQGVPQWANNMASTLDNMNIVISDVLLTHWHGDHTGGVADLIELYPHLSSGIYKNSPGKNQRPIVDGQMFSVEGATLRAVHTPGHAHDHMCFILEEENAMFTGDNILGHGTTAVEDLGLLISSWRKMLMQNNEFGYPGHGDVINKLDHKINAQIAIKIKRERMVIEALQRMRGLPRLAVRSKRESVSVHQLVLLMHGDAGDESIRALVLEPFVEDILRKLAEDGIVGFEICNGEKRWFHVQTSQLSKDQSK